MENIYTDFFGVLLKTCVRLAGVIANASQYLVYFFATPIEEIVITYDPSNLTMIINYLNLTGLGQYSLLESMLGVTLAGVLLYNFVKWILDIVF